MFQKKRMQTRMKLKVQLMQVSSYQPKQSRLYKQKKAYGDSKELWLSFQEKFIQVQNKQKHTDSSSSQCSVLQSGCSNLMTRG